MKKLDEKIYLFTKELEAIQGIISRKSSHCFLVKGWAISLVFASFLFDATGAQIFLAFFPLLAFWYLDAFFSREVKMFKILHGWVSKNRMKTDRYFFDLDPEKRFKKEIPSVLSLMFTPSIFYVYGIMFILILGFIAVNNCWILI